MVRAVLRGPSTVSGSDLAWFNCLSSEPLCIFGLHGTIYIFKKKLLVVVVFIDRNVISEQREQEKKNTAVKLHSLLFGQLSLVVLIDA